MHEHCAQSAYEDNSEHKLISRLGTLEPKGHRYIAEVSKGSYKSCLLLVLNCHFDLMITRISIQKPQVVTTRRSINNLINTRQGKRICWTSFVKVCVVHTHTPSAILLKYQHRISQPLRMKDFNNEPAAKSRATSSPIALRLSSLKRRRNCLTGLNFGSILRVCSASSLSTPGMSEGFHAKMSQFSRMNSMSALSYFGSRLALMLNCLDESPGMKSTSLVSSADLYFNKGSCYVVGLFKDVISSGSTLSL